MIELIPPVDPIRIAISLPGSKSISNRLLVLQEVLGAQFPVSNLSDSEDTTLLQKAIGQIHSGESGQVNTGDAGSDLRFLCALLATRAGNWLLDGSERMRQRPVGGLVKALRELGAEISYKGKDGFPPLMIHGSMLKGGRAEVDASVSSQFVSALLLISPWLSNGLHLVLKGLPVSRPYINMTLHMLESIGMEISDTGTEIRSRRGISVNPPSSFLVESDWSAASYWYSICALSADAEITLTVLEKDSLQGDAILTDIFRRLGVHTEFKERGVILSKKSMQARELDLDFTACPDLAQTVAVTALGLGIPATLRGLSTLKVKETDRIQALKCELEKCGTRVEAGADYLRILPWKMPSVIPDIETYADHRMAMAFAPLCLRSGKLRIHEETVVRKSYPGFWEHLRSAGFRLNLQPA